MHPHKLAFAANAERPRLCVSTSDMGNAFMPYEIIRVARPAIAREVGRRTEYDDANLAKAPNL